MRRNENLTRSLCIALTFLLLEILASFTLNPLHAQITSAPANTYQSLTTPTFGNLSVESSKTLGFDEFGNKENALNANASSVATWSYIASLGGSAWLEVKDNSAGTNGYPAGTYAGFVFATGGALSLGSTVTVQTYLGDDPAETYNPGSSVLALSLLSTNTARVGFVTSQPFDRIRITFTVPVGLAGSRSVLYAEIVRAQSGAYSVPACNTLTPLVQDVYPAVVKTGVSGITDVSVLGNVFSNVQNVVNAATTTPASITLPVAVGSRAYLSVDLAGSSSQVLPAGYFAGFEIGNTTLLGLDVAKGASVTTYRNGVRVDSVSGTSLLLGVPLLSNAGRSIVGFVTTGAFDEVRYNIASTGVNLGVTNIYRAVIKNFCERATDFPCNTLTALNSSVDPVYINMARTGVSGAIGVDNNITGADNIIDGNPNSAAGIASALNTISEVSISVKKALAGNYAAGTYVAFDVETKALLSASVVGNAVIRLYENNNPVQTSSGSSLLIGAKSSLLGNNTRQQIGVVATVPFDEIQIELTKPVGVDLGTTSIYGLNIQKNCAGTLSCNTTNIITTTPTGFGAVINNARSGVSGAVCAGCSITDIDNVVDGSSTNYAKLLATANVLSEAAISVQVPANTFAAGTFAGFLVRGNNTNLVGLNLLKSLKVELFNDNTKVAEATGTQLLGLDLLGLLSVNPSSTNLYNVGFIAPAAFDEIRIATTSLADLNVLGSKDFDVFYAVVDTRFVPAGTPGLSCSNVATLPDINYATINKQVTGSVATNDKKPASFSYGNATAINGADGLANPSGGAITLRSDGTYDFTATQAGVYSYEITLTDLGTGGTYKDNLTVTVTDPGSNTNPPVVNTDAAAVKSNNGASGYAGVKIEVLANDKASNAGKTLGAPSIPGGGNPSHGTVTVNTDGTITYVPEAGFVGTDMFTYTVCEQAGGSPCGSAYVVLKVSPNEIIVTTPGGPVTVPPSGNIVAGDDYVQTDANAAVTGNVKTNDVDPLGHTLNVTTQSITNTYGTFNLAADGSFSYTPAGGYSGTASFTYNIADATDASRTATATLYVYVKGGGTDLAVSTLLSPTQVTGSATAYFQVTVFNLTEFAANQEIKVLVPANSKISNFAFDANATNVNGTAVENNKWTYQGEINGFYTFVRTEALPAAGANSVTSSKFTMSFTFTAAPSGGGKDNIAAYLFYNGGSDAVSDNNTDAETINYRVAQQP